MTPYEMLRPLLFALDPEMAHGLSLTALKTGLIPAAPTPDRRLRQTLLGVEFANPVGLAAGYDKNGEVTDGTLGLGFGFVEVGSVTPRPQTGNPRPRMFRLENEGAIINRLGFNNDGFEAVRARLLSRRRRGIVGVNIGANRDSSDRAADYARGIARFADVADYIAVNVSSPNTPGLRDLQERRALADLLGRAVEARAAAARHVPLLVKLAPDLDGAALGGAIGAAVEAGVEGLIVGNTTQSRDGLVDHQARESGGLSGRPLFRRATIALAEARRLVGRSMVIIGVGGVDSAETAWQKLLAGADLVQLYTGMVFGGPGLPARIIAELGRRIDHAGIKSIGEIVGSEAERWAALTP